MLNTTPQALLSELPLKHVAQIVENHSIVEYVIEFKTCINEKNSSIRKETFIKI